MTIFPTSNTCRAVLPTCTVEELLPVEPFEPEEMPDKCVEHFNAAPKRTGYAILRGNNNHEHRRL